MSQDKLNQITDGENKRNALNFIRLFQYTDDNPALLDLGCGRGDLTLKLAEKIGTNRVFGAEINEDYAKIAKSEGIQVKSCDLNSSFPFESCAFDIVAANQILEHLWNTENFFSELNRVLKTGGYAVVSTVNLSSLHSLFFLLQGKQSPVLHFTQKQVGNSIRGDDVGTGGLHYRAFNIPALKDLARLYGFETEKACGVGFYFLPDFLQSVASRMLSRYAVYVTVKIRKTTGNLSQGEMTKSPQC